MTEYRVVWEIDMTGDSPREAAEAALAVMRDPFSDAVVFTVRANEGSDTGWEAVDLAEDAVAI